MLLPHVRLHIHSGSSRFKPTHMNDFSLFGRGFVAFAVLTFCFLLSAISADIISTGTGPTSPWRLIAPSVVILGVFLVLREAMAMAALVTARNLPLND